MVFGCTDPSSCTLGGSAVVRIIIFWSTCCDFVAFKCVTFASMPYFPGSVAPRSPENIMNLRNPENLGGKQK